MSNNKSVKVEKGNNILYTSRQHFGNTIHFMRISNNEYEYKGNISPEGEREETDISNDKTSVDLVMDFLTEQLEEKPKETIIIKIGEHKIQCRQGDNGLKSRIEEAMKNPYPKREEELEKLAQENTNPYGENFTPSRSSR